MTDFERRYGKVQIEPRLSGPATGYDMHGRPTPLDSTAAIPLHGAQAKGQYSSLVEQPNSARINSPSAYSASRHHATNQKYPQPPLRVFAEHYTAVPAVQALPLLDYFKTDARGAGRQAEAVLWELMEDVYRDAVQSPQYHPSEIGIQLVPPHRRWFISQYAHLQDLLQRHPVLRRANVICCWLEKVYRDEHTAQPPLRGEEEVVLRQLILTHLRGGELYRAINAAVGYGSCSHSCLLSAAQLQTVSEPWLCKTALVPLFGEYGHGELELDWCGNEHRLDNLSQLFEDSMKHSSIHAAASSPAPPMQSAAAAPGNGLHVASTMSLQRSRNDFDAVIGALLCGNLKVLESAFLMNGDWRDAAWCYLRCALVVTFTKHLMTQAGVAGDAPGAEAAGTSSALGEHSYASFIEEMTGGRDDWIAVMEQHIWEGLSRRLESRYMPQASLEDQLQMRFVLQALSNPLETYASPSFASLPGWSMETAVHSDTREQIRRTHLMKQSSDVVRVLTHFLLVQDLAYSESLSSFSVQLSASATLASSLSCYAVYIALLPQYPFDDGFAVIAAMTRRLRDAQLRAQVYAAFILAAREYELERQTLTRPQMEEQEARLVKGLISADADSAVHRGVQQLLYQYIAEEELLTHNKLAEQIMWSAMHADALEDYVAVLRRGLDCCCSFWVATPTAELDAISDVSSILVRRVLVSIHDLGGVVWMEEEAAPLKDAAAAAHRGTGQPVLASVVSQKEASEATFWYAFSEARGVSKEHAKTAAELNAAHAMAASTSSAQRTLIYQLTQDEGALLQKLIELTRRGVYHGGAVVNRDGHCISAVAWMLQQLTEAVTLSLCCGTGGAVEGSTTSTTSPPVGPPPPHHPLGLMQQVFGLLEKMNEAGYLDPQILPQSVAADLYKQMRTMRVAYGQQVQRRGSLSKLW